MRECGCTGGGQDVVVVQALDGEVVDGGGLPGGGDGDDFEAGVVGRGTGGVVGVLRLRGVQAVAGFEVPGGRPALAVDPEGVGRCPLYPS